MHPRARAAPPLLIGGGGERLTLRVVAEHADWWNADYYSPAEYARKLGILHDHCRAVGRVPGALVPSCYMGLSISRDPARLIRRRSMGHRGEVHVVSGAPDEVVVQLAAFASAGVRHMRLNFLDFPRTESLNLFLDEVLPHFDRAGTERGSGAQSGTAPPMVGVRPPPAGTPGSPCAVGQPRRHIRSPVGACRRPMLYSVARGPARRPRRRPAA